MPLIHKYLSYLPVNIINMSMNKQAWVKNIFGISHIHIHWYFRKAVCFGAQDLFKYYAFLELILLLLFQLKECTWSGHIQHIVTWKLQTTSCQHFIEANIIPLYTAEQFYNEVILKTGFKVWLNVGSRKSDLKTSHLSYSKTGCPLLHI